MHVHETIHTRLKIFSSVVLEKELAPAFFAAEMYEIAASINDTASELDSSQLKTFQSLLSNSSKELASMFGAFRNYPTLPDQLIRLHGADDKTLRDAFLSLLMRVPMQHHQGMTLDEFKKTIGSKPVFFNRETTTILFDFSDLYKYKKTEL